MRYRYEVNRTRGAFDFSVSRDYDTVYEAALALFDTLDLLHPGDWYLAPHGVMADFPPGEDLSARAVTLAWVAWKLEQGSEDADAYAADTTTQTDPH